MPAESAQIDGLLAIESIAPISDDYGSGQTNAGQPTDGTTPQENDILPIYKPISFDGSPVNVCSTNAYAGAASGAENKLGSRAFLRFTVPARGTYSISAVANTMPQGAVTDPDMILHRGQSAWSSTAASDPALCQAGQPAGCSERMSRTLDAGAYVLEVYEWTNTLSEDSATPPIGRVCLDVRIATISAP